MASRESAAVLLDGGAVTADDVAAVACRGARVKLDGSVLEVLERSRTVVERALADGLQIYGLTTRLGAGVDTPLHREELEAFQRWVVFNHDGGIGPPLPVEEVRALIFARLVGFSRGGSGVRPSVALLYAEFLNRGVHPVVPSLGSVGASDLNQLAAVAAVALGGGKVLRGGEEGIGQDIAGAEALAEAGLQPLVAEALEGLALVSANSYTVGVGALAAADLSSLLRLSGTALDASAAAWQASHETVPVQAPISFRIAPSAAAVLNQSAQTLGLEVERELSEARENPVVDLATETLRHTAGFHPAHLSQSLESAAGAVAQLAGLSERRTDHLSRLTRPFRARGVNRIPSLLAYSSAALVSEIKLLSQPASRFTPSLAEGTEDYASLAPLALQNLRRCIKLAGDVLSIEALHAADLGFLYGSPVLPRLQEAVGELYDGVPVNGSVLLSRAHRVLGGTVAAGGLFAGPPRP